MENIVEPFGDEVGPGGNECSVFKEEMFNATCALKDHAPRKTLLDAPEQNDIRRRFPETAFEQDVGIQLNMEKRDLRGLHSL